MCQVFRVAPFAALVLLLPVPSPASSPCCQASSAFQEKAAGAEIAGDALFSLWLAYDFTEMDRLRQGTSTRSLDAARGHTSYAILPVEMEMTRYTATAGYRVLPRLQALVAVPYVRNTMKMTVDLGAGLGWEESDMNPVEGLGDVTAMGLYRLLAAEAQGQFVLGLGVKTPTGEYRKRGSSGRFLHAHMQPGTGSWDPLATLRWERTARPFAFGASGTYEYATRSSEGYRVGSSASANLFSRFDALGWLGVTGGLAYLHTGRASDRDGKYTNLQSLIDDPANTGGDALWASLGLVLTPLPGAILDASLQVPAWEKVNGIQLVARYAVSAGLTVSF